MVQPANATPRSADPAELRRALDTMDFFAGLIEAAALPRSKAPSAAAAIPTIVLSGFLGAGKTTLLRHLLSGSHGMKIAALVNDFAALNIDAALIADVSDDTTALQNGCICCSLSGGVARSLAAIVERETTVDAIVIEASGVSDPSGIAHVAQTLEGITLESIVAVVDAAESTQGKAHDALVARQVAAANLILLNKCDLVSPKQAELAEARLRACAPRAQVLRTTRCAVPIGLLFDAALRPEPADHSQPAHADQTFASIVLRQSKPIDRDAFARCLCDMPSGIFRAKGFVTFADAPVPLLLQLVGRRWSLTECNDCPVETALVVIGLADSVQNGDLLGRFAAVGLHAP